jgi:hypothetical protein
MVLRQPPVRAFMCRHEGKASKDAAQQSPAFT